MTLEKSNGLQQENGTQKESARFHNATSNGNNEVLRIPVEDIAATRIQTAYRAYKVYYVKNYAYLSTNFKFYVEPSLPFFF